MATGTYDNKLINGINQIAMFYCFMSVWTQVEACDHMNPEQMRACINPSITQPMWFFRLDNE